MNQLHKGLDYKLYKIYLWGGLPLLVIYIFIATLVFNVLTLPGPKTFQFLFFPIMLWFAGIVLYWWWVFLFKGNKDLEELARTQEGEFPGIKALKNWNTLHQAMAIGGGDVDEFIRNEKKAKRPILLWFGGVNLLIVWIFCPMTLGGLELVAVPSDWLINMVYGVFIWVALMILGTSGFLRWGRKTAEKAYLTPLGLEITQVPGLKPDVISMIGGDLRLIPDGAAIVEGKRYGRLVHIETIDKHCLTAVQEKMPEFGVESNAGKLVPGKGAPGEVVKVIKTLRKAKRWQGIHVYAGPEGIFIQRQSKGTNMWLYDLWLAEYLLEKPHE